MAVSRNLSDLSKTKVLHLSSFSACAHLISVSMCFIVRQVNFEVQFSDGLVLVIHDIHGLVEGIVAGVVEEGTTVNVTLSNVRTLKGSVLIHDLKCEVRGLVGDKEGEFVIPHGLQVVFNYGSFSH